MAISSLHQKATEAGPAKAQVVEPSPPLAARRTTHRWYALALLTSIYTINNVDRNLIASLAEPIKHAFDLTDARLGALLGLAYALSCALVGLPMGLLVDRVNRSRLIAALLAAWSAVVLVTGTAQSFAALVLTRFALGTAATGASPACMSLVTDFFPRTLRATALSLYYLSTPFALIIVFSTAGFMAETFGWRAVFFIWGGLGLLLSMLVIATLREPQRGGLDRDPATAERSSLRAVAGLIVQRQVLLYLMVAAVATIVGQSGYAAFLSPYFVRVHHLSIAQAGLYAAVILGGAGVIGIPLGGFIADLLSKWSPRSSPYLVAIMVALAVPLGVAGFLAATPMHAVAGILACHLLASFFYGTSFAAYLSAGPPNMRGALGSFLYVAMNLVGYGVGPGITGFLSDLFQKSGVREPLRWATTSVLGAFVVAAVFFFLAGRAMKDTSSK